MAVRKAVRTPTEYRDALKAADTLDLGVKEHDARGAWETTDGEPLFISGDIELVKASQSTFHVRIRGEDGPEVVRARPTTSSHRDEGTLVLHLTAGAYSEAFGPAPDVDLYQPNA